MTWLVETVVGAALLGGAGYGAGCRQQKARCRRLLGAVRRDGYDTGLRNGMALMDRINAERAERMSSVTVDNGSRR